MILSNENFVILVKFHESCRFAASFAGFAETWILAQCYYIGNFWRKFYYVLYNLTIFSGEFWLFARRIQLVRLGAVLRHPAAVPAKLLLCPVCPVRFLLL